MQNMMNIEAAQLKWKVSILARLMAAFTYMIPGIGSTLSSLYLMKSFKALSNNETAGMSIMLIGLTESTIPALALLYFGAFCGLIVILVLIVRMFMETKTASPPSWFFIVCGLFFLVPVGLFFEASSMVIEAVTIPNSSTNMGTVVGTVSLLLMLSIASMLVVSILMLVMSVIPFSTASKPRFGSLITVMFVEFLIIIAVIVFHSRYLWLYEAALAN